MSYDPNQHPNKPGLGQQPAGSQPQYNPGMTPPGMTPPGMNPAMGGAPYYGQPKTSGLAIASLVFGIISLVFSCLTGIVGIVCGIIALVQISGSNGTQKGTGLAITGIVLSMLLALVGPALLLPAVQSVRAAARDVEVQNNLRQIALSALNYQTTTQHFPENIRSRDDDRLLLSWRVAILPFAEQSFLFDQFNPSEPWDSPHNLEIARQNMPQIYARPGQDLEPGLTCFKRAEGNGALFEIPVDGQPNRGIRPEQIQGGLTNTILYLETNPEDAVMWTKPEDHQFDPGDPKRGLGGARGYLIYVRADGSGNRARLSDISDAELSREFTRADD